MTTSKKIAPLAAPIKPTASNRSAKKAAPLQAASKKKAAKKPSSKAPTPVGPPKKVLLAKPIKAAKARTAKVEKPKKPKLVRDSFTIPKVEYVVLEALKQRAVQLKRSIKKSELLRAGIKALAALPDAAFLTALDGVPALKTGRPVSSK